MTGDERVLPTIQVLCERLYLAQVLDPELYKDRMHGGKPQAKNFLKGGIEIDQHHLQIAYDCVYEHTHKETGYMGYRFATGAYTPVGRQGLSIVVHDVAGDRECFRRRIVVVEPFRFASQPDNPTKLELSYTFTFTSCPA